MANSTRPEDWQGAKRYAVRLKCDLDAYGNYSMRELIDKLKKRAFEALKKGLEREGCDINRCVVTMRQSKMNSTAAGA